MVDEVCQGFLFVNGGNTRSIGPYTAKIEAITIALDDWHDSLVIV